MYVILKTCLLLEDWKSQVQFCSENTESWLEEVIEHLVGRQSQPKGFQVHAVQLSGHKGRRQDLPLPRHYLRVGRREEYPPGDLCIPKTFQM